MILVDISNILFRMIYGESSDKKSDMNLDLVRKLCFNKLKMLERKFPNDSLVICFDQGKSWRFDIHPGYKSGRKKVMDERKITARQFFDQLKEEFLVNLPYLMCFYERAEADDVMATLSTIDGIHTIVSGDGDMIQLTSDRVVIFNPFNLKGAGSYMPCFDTDRFKYEHVMCGDSGDSVPNVKSLLNTFESGGRQTAMTQKFQDAFYSDYVNGNYGSLSERIKQNQRLVLLEPTVIPADIQAGILANFEEDKTKLKKRIRNFVNYVFANNLSLVIA